MYLDRDPDLAGPPDFSVDSDRNAAWAHASGWAQLYGERRALSCVLLADAPLNAVAQVLPELSDALTEAGFPWELVALCSRANTSVAELLQAWSELPGIRHVALPRGTSPAQTLTEGLRLARGDAVLVLGEAGFGAVSRVPAMVSQWCDGQEVVSSGIEALSLLDRRALQAVLTPR